MYLLKSWAFAFVPNPNFNWVIRASFKAVFFLLATAVSMAQEYTGDRVFGSALGAVSGPGWPEHIEVSMSFISRHGCLF